MSTDPQELTYLELLALLAGDAEVRARLTAGEHLKARTPFTYPSRREAVVLDLAPASPSTRPPVKSVRISDCGGLLRSLADQGMDLEVDMVLSKTVFHAVKQQEGAGITGGQVYVDSPPDKVGAAIWSMLQLIAEVTGLRHAKYKDALLQLERRRSPESDYRSWRPT